MEAISASRLWFLSTFLFLLLLQKSQCGVTYDRKALVINGQRRILFCGSIHYPRSTPQMWEDLIRKAKRGGLDCIDTYVFWNKHEPSPNNYDFQGSNDLVHFLKLVQKAGLYVHLRIGPYVCAEWNFGGFPVWLKNVPGITFRTDNEPFKREMEKFTQKIVQMMKDEKLFESQGGPIIMSQIENEYERQGQANGAAGSAYMNWAAQMAVKMDTGVPWIMSKEVDAPDPVINTCNGLYCDYFSANKPYKPTMWTEAWTGWFTDFGGPTYQRPIEDMAFAVARFIERGGSFINYYMYHGGTNFGRTSGGPFVTTSYDYDAPIDEYGLIRQPKHGHLRELHKAIKLCEPALVSADPNVTSLGHFTRAHVFSSRPDSCAAFLSNINSESAELVVFNNVRYKIPPWSISILPDCRNVVFNTAKVRVQTTQMNMLPANAKFFSWKTFREHIFSGDHHSTVTASGLLDHLSVTNDISDYLWYRTSVSVSDSESFLRGGELPTLLVQSRGDVLHVFINGKLSGSIFGSINHRRLTYTRQITLQAGHNEISLLSVAVGLPNIGRNFELFKKGIHGPVALYGLDHGKKDLSMETWSYKVGLKGESMNLMSPSKSSAVEWLEEAGAEHKQRPLTWYKAYFDAPEGNDPLALDMSSMGKGEVWINGRSIGRYWTVSAKGNCTHCNITGTYRPVDCELGCGQPSQKWYHVPRSWLQPSQNLLVLFEELGGIASRISLVKRALGSVCAGVSEQRLGNVSLQAKSFKSGKFVMNPKLHLRCATGQAISAIRFASFGNPSGACGSFKQGACHAQSSYDVLKQNCIGKQRCHVTVSKATFGTDPCPTVLKKLSVEAVCAPKTGQNHPKFKRMSAGFNSSRSHHRDRFTSLKWH